MTKYFRFIPLFCLCWAGSGVALESKSRLAVKEPRFVDIENSSFYTEQTLKLAQKMIWEHGGYHPVFSQTDENSFHNLHMNVFKQDGHYALKFSVTDPKGRTVKKAWAFGIKRRFLLLQIRLSFYEMLHGKAAVKRMVAKAKKRNQTPDPAKAGKDAGKDAGASGGNSGKDGEDKDKSGEMASLLNTLVENKSFSARTSLDHTGELATAFEEFLLKKKALKN